MPESQLEVLTVAQLLGHIEKRIDQRRHQSRNEKARREFSIAITAVQDAQMRYTRGRAIEDGKFKPGDLDG